MYHRTNSCVIALVFNHLAYYGLIFGTEQGRAVAEGHGVRIPGGRAELHDPGKAQQVVQLAPKVP